MLKPICQDWCGDYCGPSSLKRWREWRHLPRTMCVRNRFHTESLGEGKFGNMHCRPLTTDLSFHPAMFHSILRIYPKKQWDLCSIILGLPWLRIHLPTRETWVQSSVQEDSMCQRATNPMHHNYWSLNVLEPTSSNYRAHVLQLLKPAHLQPVLTNFQLCKCPKPRAWSRQIWGVCEKNTT